MFVRHAGETGSIGFPLGSHLTCYGGGGAAALYPITAEGQVQALRVGCSALVRIIAAHANLPTVRGLVSHLRMTYPRPGNHKDQITNLHDLCMPEGHEEVDNGTPMICYFVNARQVELVADCLAKEGVPPLPAVAEATWRTILFENTQNFSEWPDVEDIDIATALNSRLSGERPANEFFDTSFYSAFHKVRLEDAFLHWCRTGAVNDLTFNPLFDPTFYIDEYGGGGQGFRSATLHFVNRGIFENFVCSEWIASLDYLVKARSIAAGPVFLELYYGAALPIDDRYAATVEYAGPFANIYDAYRFDATGKWLTGRGLQSYELMLLYFSAVGRDRSDRPSEAEWLRLLTEQFPGRSGSRLIDGEFIAMGANNSSALAETGSVRWWLTDGRKQHYVPNRLFDANYYRRAYPDIRGWSDFEHYLLHGRFEGRQPFEGFDAAYCRARYGMAEREDTLHCLLEIERPVTSSLTHIDTLGTRRDNEPARRWLTKLGKVRYFDVALSTDARRAHAFAGDLDPLVTLSEGRRIVWVPDVVTDKLVRAERLRHAAKGMRGKIAVLAPSSAKGGAWTACLNVLNWLGDRACLVLTDSASNDVPELRKRFNVIDMPALGCGGDLDLLYDLLRGIECDTAFNINSAVMWQLLAAQGRNIAPAIKVFAFLFCFHHDTHDRKDGYSARYVLPTMRHVAGYILDNAAHRNELIALHGPSFEARSTVVYHPIDPPRNRWSPNGDKGAIFWAGRFDRQKKFEILLEVAKHFPEERFNVWGFPKPDKAAVAKWPDNVSYEGQFNSFDEVDFATCKAWFFSSRFEGMPITLVEIASRGVPIISSIVGGTGEVISEATGWPVHGESVDAYVEALAGCLESHAERVARGKAAATLIASRHSKVVYEMSLSAFCGVSVQGKPS